MKITINESEFINRFLAIRPENFSREALRALFEYYEEIEQGGGGELEFDPIAICCDWTEYDSAQEAADAYDLYVSVSTGGEEKKDLTDARIIELLRDDTTVLELSSGCVVLNF
jgi:hypothetical protein